MTTFLVDVSGAYSNLSGVKAAGAAGVISRCMTEPGTIDAGYAPTQAAAKAIGLMGGAYCWLTGDLPSLTVEQRAERFIAAIGDPSDLAIMLDTETPEYPALHPAPTASDIARWMTVWRSHYPAHPVLDYLPRWYWTGHLGGGPDLSSVGPLWASAYPGWTSFADYISHAGDSNPEWSLAYAGSPRPDLWQFAGSVAIGGVNADLTAFRGSLAELRALALGRTDVNLDRITYQSWTANGTNGVLRDAPDRSLAPSVTLPAGTKIVSIGEYVSPDGNNWRAAEWPVGSHTVRWFLRYGPGIPADHDFIAGPFVTFGASPAELLTAEQAGYDLAVNGVKVGSIQPPVTFPPRPA